MLLFVGRLFAFISLCFLLSSCTREVSDLSVQVTLPSLPAPNGTSSSSTKVTSLSGPFSLGSEDSLDNINCFMLTVGAVDPSEAGFKRNRCYKGENEIRFGSFISGLQRGVSKRVELRVKRGSKRTIKLWGIRTEAGKCRNLLIDREVVNGWTMPRVLATKIIDLTQPEQVLNLSLPSSTDISSRAEAENCEIEGITHSGESPPLAGFGLFGSGSDGDLSLDSTPINLSSDTTTSGRIMSAQRRLVSLSADGLELTTGAVFSANDFQVGDEVMWHVAAAMGSSGPDDGCAGNLYTGSYGFQRISDITGGNSFRLDGAIGDTTHNNTHIAQDNATGASFFCRIQVLRVPHFNNITATSAATITVNPYTMASSSGSGGILAFRVSGKIDTSNHSISLDASVKGYEAQLGQGSSFSGLGTDLSAFGRNTGGGGSAPNSLGGGGGAGAGDANGSSANAGGNGGFAPNVCVGTACDPISDKKMFFGSSGGGSNINSDLGSSGGGIVMVHAADVIGVAPANELALKASGGSGNVTSGGSGGGAIHLTTKSSTVNLNFQARGGDHNSLGGAGGGGLVDAVFCTDPGGLKITDVFAGTSDASPAAPGNIDFSIESFVCTE